EICVRTGRRAWSRAMIRFACKQCGATFERPGEAAGTLVFCTCGAGNRVPWESTLPEMEPDAATAPQAPVPSSPIPLREEQELPPVRRRDGSLHEHRTLERDPAFCLNHPDLPSQMTCQDCGEPFCSNCIVTIQGQSVCGPCKNFRIRTMQRPGQFSVSALFSLLLGIFTGPFGLFCVSLSAGMRSTFPSFAALLIPLAAML